MALYLIDISACSLSHDYSSLWQTMVRIGAQRCFDASWLMDSDQDLQTVTDALASYCAPGDGLFLVELTAQTRWSGTGLNDEVKAWIAQRTVGGALVIAGSEPESSGDQ